MYNLSQLFKDYNAMDSRNVENRVLIVDPNTGTPVEYLSDTILDLYIQSSIITGEEFTIGTLIPKKLTLKLKSTTTIPRAASVIPFVRLNGLQGPTAWVSLGTYFIDRRSNVDDIFTLTCLDMAAAFDMPFNSQLTYPNTMKAVFDEIMSIFPLTPVANISTVREIPYKDEEITMREMLSYIASAHGGSFIVTNNDELKLIKFNDNTIRKEIFLNEYFKVEQTNPLKTLDSIEVTINDNQETIKVTKPGSGAANTILFYNPYIWIDGANTGLLDEVASEIDFAYTPCKLEWKGDPQLELGDTIKINLKDGTSFTTKILNQTLSFKGGMKSTILSPSNTDYESEFSFKSLLNKIKKAISGLQEDEVYYGVSIGREYGLKISRSDGFSEVLLNSDVMSFRAKDQNGNMIDRIYFDPVEGNYNFTGNLHITNTDGTTEVLFDGNETTFRAKDENDIMRDRIYFDTLKGNYVFDGLLSVTALEAVAADIDVVVSETVIVNNLYATRGRIAELTVDHLLTGDFLAGDETIFYIDIVDDKMEFIQAFKNSDPMIQYTTYEGSPLYWETADQELMITEETDWPVMIHQYDASTVYSVKIEDFTDSQGTMRIPVMTFGRGDGFTTNSAKGKIYKDRTGLVFEYHKSNTGNVSSLRIDDFGIKVTGEDLLNPSGPTRCIRNTLIVSDLSEAVDAEDGDIIFVVESPSGPEVN